MDAINRKMGLVPIKKENFLYAIKNNHTNEFYILKPLFLIMWFILCKNLLRFIIHILFILNYKKVGIIKTLEKYGIFFIFKTILKTKMLLKVKSYIKVLTALNKKYLYAAPR